MTESSRTVAGSDDPAPAHGEGDANSAVVYYRAATPETDRFSRRQPALLEGPEQAWKASRDLIDFGVRLLELSGRVQTSSDEEKVREFAYLALLRRALVTTEAAWMLLAKGLYEPALAQIRTLLDVQLNINLIHGDASPKMAIRLGAYHYLRNQRHGEKALRDRDTRIGALTDGLIERTIEVARSYARHLESPVFDSVRDDLRTSRHWHGHSSVEEAFRSAGDSSDYFVSYDSFTPFVHASNIDHDFEDDGDASGPKLRPLVERDPQHVQIALGFVSFRFLDVVQVFVKARGLPSELTAEAARQSMHLDGLPIRDEDVVVDTLTGMTQALLDAFPSRDIPVAELPSPEVQLIESREINPPGGVRQLRCSNPNHPQRPGPCPNGHDGPFAVAALGGSAIMCLRCKAVWSPAQ
jgi:hypothetical protein